MNKPYLIQRAKFENREGKPGVDAVLQFDYMGAAEFEFGAIPKSLARVRENIDNYTQFQYSFKSNPTKVVTVMCQKGEEESVCQIIEGLSKGEFHLKGFCDLDGWVNDKKPHAYNRNDFWWDIEQDWFFWKFTPDFDLKFKDALTNKPA